MSEPSPSSSRSAGHLPLAMNRLLKSVQIAACSVAGWALLQTGYWLLANRDDLQGSAWVAAMKASARSLPGRTPSQEIVPCLQIPANLYEITPIRHRRRLAELLGRYEVELRLLDHHDHDVVPESECSTVWVQPSDDFETPILGKTTIAYRVGGDYNGDAVFMFFAFGRWFHLYSWESWS